MHRESGIGGIEQMMAFVEHIAHAALPNHLLIRIPVLPRLRDHQRMVRDHD